MEPFRIMVIDDDITLTNSIKLLLNQNGYITIVANTGIQAMELLNSTEAPNLILLDISMPDVDGLTIYTNIKSKYNVPVIFLTATTDKNTELMCLQMGAIDYITKPFITDILLARINNHLNNIYRYTPDHMSTPVGETGTLAVKLDQDKLAQMKQLLTESEYRIGKRIALGYTNHEIAEELNYSYSYVKKVAYRIFDKLGISKRIEIRPFFTN